MYLLNIFYSENELRIKNEMQFIYNNLYLYFYLSEACSYSKQSIEFHLFTYLHMSPKTLIIFSFDILERTFFNHMYIALYLALGQLYIHRQRDEPIN